MAENKAEKTVEAPEAEAQKTVATKVSVATHRNLKLKAALEDTTVQDLVAGILDDVAKSFKLSV